MLCHLTFLIVLMHSGCGAVAARASLSAPAFTYLSARMQPSFAWSPPWAPLHARRSCASLARWRAAAWHALSYFARPAPSRGACSVPPVAPLLAPVAQCASMLRSDAVCRHDALHSALNPAQTRSVLRSALSGWAPRVRSLNHCTTPCSVPIRHVTGGPTPPPRQ